MAKKGQSWQFQCSCPKNFTGSKCEGVLTISIDRSGFKLNLCKASGVEPVESGSEKSTCSMANPAQNVVMLFKF